MEVDLKSDKKQNNGISFIDVNPASEQDGIDLLWEPYGQLDIKSYKKRIWKNIILISFIFMLNFISFGGLSSLQSSLHIQQGMGVICSAILYVALVLSSLFLPNPLIYWLGHKWVVTLSLIGYILWMFANGYGVWATMIPASIIVGICGAPLWTAQCAYFTILGKQYAAITHQDQPGVIALFFGVFFMFFQANAIFGNIISTTILRPTTSENDTAPGDDDIAFCGINDCPGNNVNNTNLEKPPNNVVWTLCAVYIIIAVTAVIISAVFVDNLPKAFQMNRNKDKTICKESSDIFGATFKQLANKKQLLLIPITIYSGLEQSFRGADFSKSWVTCSLGIWMVGLVNIPMGIVDAGASFVSGRVVKYIGRLPLFITGLIIDNCLQITLATWEVNPDQRGVYFTISSFWGASDAIWQTQINALYGVIFAASSEAAFSNYRLWESMGFIIGYGYSSFLCAPVKLYILFTMLWIGLIGYFIVEWMHGKTTDIELTRNLTVKKEISAVKYTVKDTEIFGLEHNGKIICE